MSIALTNTVTHAGTHVALDERLDAILHAIDSGQSDGLSDLSALVSEVPDFAPAYGHYAWALASHGRHEEAIALYERIAQMQPENPEPLWRMADRLINIGRLDEALTRYQQVLSDWPDSLDAKMGVRYVKHLQKNIGNTKPQRYIRANASLSDLQQSNAALNQQEYDAERLKLRSLPTDLYLESTTKCNFYCTTCSKGYDAYYAEDLRRGILDRVKTEVMPANTRISITGFGEPTLASDFDEILGMSMDNGSTVHFVTNASLLNYDRIERLTRLPVHITISMDGATKQTFEDIRRGSNFDLILEKLAMIKKLRDVNLSGARSQFSFNFVALRKNIHELPELIRLAHRFGIPSVGVADYAFNNNEFDEQSLRYEPLTGNTCLHEAVEVASQLGVQLHVPPDYNVNAPPSRHAALFRKILAVKRIFPKARRFPTRCSSPWKEPYIHTDGMVTPCCSSGQYLGDLSKSTFANVWNGWRYRLLRLRIHSFLPPLGCRNCFVCWGINAGNPANVKAEEGLVVKALYWLEVRYHGYLGRLKAYWKKVRATGAGKDEPAPNFKLGRPWKPAEVDPQSTVAK